MKKLTQTIKDIWKTISKVIDKLFVMPITKFIVFIGEKFSKPSKKFESWLSRSNTLLFISLIIAIAIFIVIDKKIDSFSNSSAEVIKAHNISVLYDEDNYVVEGIPDNIDITLIGSKANLYLAKQSPAQEVIIDLWGLGVGTHKVDIKYDQIYKSINYSVNPSVATVIIYEKVANTKKLTVDLLNQDAIDERYIISNVESTADTATVKGASYKVDKVATVKALVDINSLPKIELNKKVTVSSTLRAYDESGQVVDVEISPAKVDVDLMITSPSKEVPIQVIPQGKVVYNMGISSLTVNNSATAYVTLYGPEDVLSTIDYLPVTVDVEGLTSSSTFNVELIKHPGVKAMSMNNVSVRVDLSSDISNIEINDIGISAINHGDYSVEPIGFDRISVKLKGVTEIVEGIKAENINAYVDLTNLGPGEHEVDIVVEGNDPRVEYLPSVLKMKVRIYEKRS